MDKGGSFGVLLQETNRGIQFLVAGDGFLMDLVFIWGRFGAGLESLWASLWYRFGVTLESLWENCGMHLGSVLII